MTFKDVRMRGFRKRIKLKDAIDLAVSKFKLFNTQTISLRENQISNFILRENCTSLRSIPPFNRSAVDGYAIKAEDTFSASDTNPMLLKVIGKLSIGEVSDLSVEQGTVIQIPTGGVIPDGANAVIMLEDTRKIRKESEFIEVTNVLHPGKNISTKGEDFEKGQLLLEHGHKFRSIDRGIFRKSLFQFIDLMSFLSITTVY